MEIKVITRLTNKISSQSIYQHAFNLTVLVAGLGYLVDTFDFFLYNAMRVSSLSELGLSGDTLTKTGIIIHNCQVFGALVGSFFWGILGDKKGRKSALLGSILLYSLCMLANGFVHDITSYAIIRLLLGFGVAGEVGLGATLVAETVQSSKRTYSLMLFTIMGVIGVVIAGLSLEFMSWRVSCIIGGIIGLALLLLRSVLSESQLFIDLSKANKIRGSLRQLFGSVKNLKRYLFCIPILGCNFFVTGLILTLSPEIAKATDVNGFVKANIALVIYFVTAIFGDWLGAWLSEMLQKRNLVTGIFIALNAALAFLLLQKLNLDIYSFYLLCACFGLFNLWALSGTILVEQFPTELRATATTSNINFSRAMIIVMNLSLLALRPFGIINAFSIISFVIFGLALFCVWRLPETYGQSLNEVSVIPE